MKGSQQTVEKKLEKNLDLTHPGETSSTIAKYLLNVDMVPGPMNFSDASSFLM
jgi:hypothetical protein